MPSAGRSRERGELGVEVGVDGRRDVAVQVVVAAVTVAQGPADVQDSGRVRLSQPLPQGGGVDQHIAGGLSGLSGRLIPA